MSTLERGILATVGLIVVLSLILSGEDHSSQSETAEAHLTAADVARIANRTERLRDLRFKHPVKPLFLDRDRAVEVAEQANRRDYPDSKRRLDEETLKLVGLLGPDDDLGQVLKAIEGEQILGFYDPKTKRLVVIKDDRASRPLLEITLAHELTHALEDQHFKLFSADSDLTDDRASAENAMIEGSATEVMMDYARRYLTFGDLAALASAADTETKLPPYVEQSLLFPYLQGQKFVETFKGQVVPGEGGSWGAFNNLLAARRAVSTEQILHPRRFALDDRPKRVQMPDVARQLGPQWQRVDSSSVGEFDLREFFKLLGKHADAQAAEGWGGGRFELWQPKGADDDCNAPCLGQDVGVLRFDWDTPADRAQAEPQFRRMIEKGLHGKRLGPRRDVGIWSSRGGVIGLLSGPRTTTIVFAPDAGKAARVLAARD